MCCDGPENVLRRRTQTRTLRGGRRVTMAATTATAARAGLYSLIDQVNDEAQPVTITGKRGNAVLVGEADWEAIQETLLLASIPGMAESIRAARSEGIDAASPDLDW
ncbi:hypothetical protein QR98_0071350 [Sarcoptes scabiei]|uniref:Antitoxin n=1 Tax=Sarcoptes scabiei TaxID=52283 RepID=A0A132ACG4_SARSC|nr:hypothetical protein QR98_0071350 [Sarcoptes scabiei]